MKLLHLTVFRELSNGQRKQITYEVRSSKDLEEDWHSIVYHCGAPKNSFERRIPFGFRSLLGRRFFFWLIIVSQKRNYDLIIYRHVPFDPFSLIFGWFVKNRIPIHHGKEIKELKLVQNNWKGITAAFAEKLIGLASASQISRVAGVTQDIADHRASTYHRGKNIPTLIYPNGIQLTAFDTLDDKRTSNPEKINAAFVCGHFSPWHGLDLLLDSIEDTSTSFPIKIHLVGKLSQTDLARVRTISQHSDTICYHGFLENQDYHDLLAGCDIGIGSLAMHRQQLNEGATLKVREYLGLGLPVFSGHIDTAIPQDFMYYYIADTQRNLDIKELYDFGALMKKYSREQVREKSEIFISKYSTMSNFIEKIKSD